MPYTVSLICMPYMYALYVCLTCITICLICLLYMPCIVFLVLGLALLLSCVTSCVPAAPAVRSTVCQLWTMDLRGCVVCGVWCVVAAGDRWHINSTKQLVWAMSHCLCPNCNGTHPGECEECVPRSPGCDVRPPEYDCWMDVRTRTSGWPLYDTGVGLE